MTHIFAYQCNKLTLIFNYLFMPIQAEACVYEPLFKNPIFEAYKFKSR